MRLLSKEAEQLRLMETGADRHSEAVSAPNRRKHIVNIGLMVFFGFYFFIGFSGGEAFPFSTFPMYSVARLDPYVVPSQQIFAYTNDGDEYIVTDQSIRGRVRAMRREIVLEEVDEQAIAAFADELLRRINSMELTPDPARGLRVMELKVQIPPVGEGEPLDTEVLSATVLIDATADSARFSPAALPSDDNGTAP